MKALELKGLGSADNRSYFILKKENFFKNYFNKILEKAGIDDRIYDEQGLILERNNEIDHFKNKNFDIDVIYTSNRIIILVRADPLKLDYFKSIVLSYSKLSNNKNNF